MSFFSDFTGRSAQRDIRRADRQATSALTDGFNQQSQRYDQAAGMFDPFVQEGRQGSEMYNALIGLRGGDAANTAYGTLSSLPAFQGQLAQDSNALLRNLNARGMGGGGTAAMAGQRVLQQSVGNWLDRFQQAGQQGFQASNALAGTRMAQGDNAMGFGATRANQAVGLGNAMAGTRNTALNNLIGLAGAGANIASTAMGVPRMPR